MQGLAPWCGGIASECIGGVYGHNAMGSIPSASPPVWTVPRVAGGELRHSTGLPRAGGDMGLCHTLIRVHTVWIKQSKKKPAPCQILKISVNRASMICGHSSWLITARWGPDCLYTSFESIYRLKSSATLSWSFENELRCESLGGGRGNISYLSAYKCCQLMVYRCLWSMAT